MHFGFASEMSNVDLLNTDLLDTHLDLLDTGIPSKYFACLHNVFKTSSRHAFKTSSRRLQDQKMFAGYIPTARQNLVTKMLSFTKYIQTATSKH